MRVSHVAHLHGIQPVCCLSGKTIHGRKSRCCYYRRGCCSCLRTGCRYKNKELQPLLGKKNMEVEILKEAAEYTTLQ